MIHPLVFLYPRQHRQQEIITNECSPAPQTILLALPSRPHSMDQFLTNSSGDNVIATTQCHPQRINVRGPSDPVVFSNLSMNGIVP